MSYWLTLAGILMLGYTLIRWNERANEQDQNRFDSGTSNSVTGLDIRSVTVPTLGRETGNAGEDEGNRGGEA